MALEVFAVFAVLLAPVFAEYARIRAKSARGFNLIFAAGTMFLLAWGFTVFSGTLAANIAPMGELLFDFIGWVLLLVGAITVALDLSKAKK
ncbi:MAG: hypothetical protein KKA90_04545 [Nanoarchaeota archaeon]|nr:hypothetical protein [Nanoarchaeota archaeon]